MKASANGRYLVDQNAAPFLMVGDSAQGLFDGLGPTDAATYLDTRKSQGFNSLLVEIVSQQDQIATSPKSATGALPFLKNSTGGTYDGSSGTADFWGSDGDSINTPYWDFVDSIIDLANQRGMLVMLYVLPWGYNEGGDQGWWPDLVNSANTQSNCQAFGNWLGNRYKGRSNVIWVDGSDDAGNSNPAAPDGTSGIQRALAITQGMLAAGAKQLRTGDWRAPSLSTDESAFTPLMQLNGIYSYGGLYPSSVPVPSDPQHTYLEARAAYNYVPQYATQGSNGKGTTPPALPAFLKETSYEHSPFSPGDPTSVRKAQWWAVLSGGTAGLLYGNENIWPFRNGTWQNAIQDLGAMDMARMASFLNSIAWQTLVPAELAGMRQLVTSANGTQSGEPDNYVAAAQASDGTLLVAYVPPYGSGSQTVTFDLRSMAGTTRARFWDPTSAEYANGGQFKRGSATLTTPGANAGGANDWLIVFDLGSGSNGSGGATDTGGFSGSGSGGTGGSFASGGAGGSFASGGAGGSFASGGAGGSFGSGVAGSSASGGGIGVTGTSTIGETNVLPIDDYGNGNMLLAQPATLTEPAAIESLSFYVTNAAGNLRLGIYDASGANGGPGQELAETSEFAPIVGWNTTSVSSSVSLPPAKYWIAYFPSSNNLHFRRAGSGSFVCSTLTYGAMPSTFPSSTVSGSDHWSFYATLNAVPTVSTPASAFPSLVSGTSTQLTVLGSGALGESAITYTWSILGTPAAPVTFSPNGSNAAKNTIATFAASGLYTFRATLEYPNVPMATSDVNVTVASTPTTVSVTPANAAVTPNHTVTFMNESTDQFASALAVQPSSTWSVNGGGTIGSSSGVFTAGAATGGPFTVTVTSGGLSGTAQVTVVSAALISIGETSVLPTTDYGNANLLLAQPASLSQTATIESLSFYVASPAGKLRLGIYDASGPGGTPGKKIAETAELTPVTGWNTANVSSPVSVAAGSYWLAYLPSSNDLQFRRAGSGSYVYCNLTYGPMPSTFCTPLVSGSDHWSFYATLQP